VIDVAQIEIAALPRVALEARCQLPKCQGIYFAVVAGEVVYIGKAKNLNNRWLGHHRLIDLKQYDDVVLSWLQVDGDTLLLNAVESACIERFRPAMNGTEVSANSKGNKSFSVTLPQELSDRLDAIAKREWRTASKQLEAMLWKAIREYDLEART
jgi:hypothetical protein